ncbi:hypothetical protein R6Q57_023226 [Mikania cordata]
MCYQSSPGNQVQKLSVLHCDVTEIVLMKCFLLGMPDLKMGLNGKIGLEKQSQFKSRPTKSGKSIELDDVTFHQCVNLTRYRITEGVTLPFRVLPTIKELGGTRMEVNVKVREKSGYIVEWVRYITKEGSYEIGC